MGGAAASALRFRPPQLCHPDRSRSSQSDDLRSGGTLCLLPQSPNPNAPPVQTISNLKSLPETGWRPEPPIIQETAWRKLITAPRENGGPKTKTARITPRRRWRRCVSMPRKILPRIRTPRKPPASQRVLHHVGTGALARPADSSLLSS